LSGLLQAYSDYVIVRLLPISALNSLYI
jgi:hypothetical protein